MIFFYGKPHLIHYYIFIKQKKRHDQHVSYMYSFATTDLSRRLILDNLLCFVVFVSIFSIFSLNANFQVEYCTFPNCSCSTQKMFTKSFVDIPYEQSTLTEGLQSVKRDLPSPNNGTYNYIFTCDPIVNNIFQVNFHILLCLFSSDVTFKLIYIYDHFRETLIFIE